MKSKRKYMSLLLALIFTIAIQTPTISNSMSEATTVQYIPIQPLWQNVSTATVTLTISGTTAHCSTTIIGLTGTTRISATMRLERTDGTTVRTWSQTVNGSRLTMIESNAITANGSYRLRVDATVVRNGVSESISISG
jgi:hypothetical protein